MLSKIKKASIAIVACDNDVHLFFECVFEEEFDMRMFFDVEFGTVLEKQEEFDYVIVDSPTALKENRHGRWDSICQVFEKRIFVLACSNEISKGADGFLENAKTLPYPFTKKNFYLFFASLSPEKKSVAMPGRDRAALKNIPQFSRLIGSCEKLDEVRQKILMVADTDTPLIFFGESGTGKTMAAKIAHELSLRKDKPFVIANMANARGELIESSLFGNVRGAFTDARDRQGLFRKANGGTLFMDEIAELSLECQAKILRVIESGVFRPIGSDEEFKSDVRLIFATNADLPALVRNRLFREDLYWRIVDFPIQVPPLRERVEDFPLLIENELNEIQKKTGKSFSITSAAVQKMSACDWPGNFRQFKACLRRAAILCRDTCLIDADSISF